MPFDSECTEASFLLNLTYLLCLQLVQVPRSPDLAICVHDDDNNDDDMTDYFTPCPCVQGKNFRLHIP